MNALLSETGIAAFKLILEAYEKDKSNRYILTKPWVLPDINQPLPDFENQYFIIVSLRPGWCRITVKPYGGDTCDGATFAFDKPKGVKPAALFHDPWYLSIPEMAKTWGWSEEAVRLVGDGIFSTVMRRAGSRKILARIYYNAVYYFGGIFRSVGHHSTLIIVSGTTILLLGCAGCRNPPDWSDPDSPYTEPEFEQVK